MMLLLLVEFTFNYTERRKRDAVRLSSLSLEDARVKLGEQTFNYFHFKLPFIFCILHRRNHIINLSGLQESNLN